MLEVLRISNLAIAEKLEIDFDKGLNVLTGETGAGKSIILKAIELLTGKRTSADVIGTNGESAEVEGLFRIAPALAAELKTELPELEDLLTDDELLIRRVVDRSGKSKLYLNGRLSTAGALQTIAPRLVDVTGQHQQQTLLDVQRHREVLDASGVAGSLLKQVREAYEVFSAAQKRLEEFTQQSAVQLERLRRFEFERDELRDAKLREGERAECEAELKRLSNLEFLSAASEEIETLLESGDVNVRGQLVRTEQLLTKMAGSDSQLSEALGLIQSAKAQISEARFAAADYISRLEADPNRLEYLRERIADVARLERKYGKSETELVQYLAKIQAELAQLENGELSEDKLRAVMEEARGKLTALEEKLTAERKRLGAKLAKEVERELGALNMKRAEFSIDVQPANSSAFGADRVEFLFSANLGQELRPLAKVASGGELSRVLLIVKTVLNEKRKPLLQVFDEVDAGIGGAVAQVVGEKLGTLAKNAQIIVVTHAPQIAAFADKHFQIEKSVSGKRTLTSVSALDSVQRIDEIARMLAGKTVTPEFQASARELLRAKHI